MYPPHQVITWLRDDGGLELFLRKLVLRGIPVDAGHVDHLMTFAPNFPGQSVYRILSILPLIECINRDSASAFLQGPAPKIPAKQFFLSGVYRNDARDMIRDDAYLNEIESLEKLNGKAL